MAKMFEIKDNKATFIATAHEFLRGQAYIRANELASEHDCVATDILVKIGEKTEKRLKVTAKTKTNRDAFVTAFEGEYAKAHKAYAKAKGKTEKKPTASTRKPKADAPKKAKGKLTLDEFIKANPLCTREEAKAHGFEGTRADLRARKEKLGVR